MSLPRKALTEGEVVEHDLHPHWKTLAGPVLVLLVGTFVGSYALFAVPAGTAQAAGRFGVLAVVLFLLLWLVVRPFLRWRTTNFVLTNRRIVVRTGIFSRSGHDVPLLRVNDVSFTHSLPERLLGCGTLTVESAGERGQLVLTDVPAVETVSREVYRLIEAEELRRRRGADLQDHTGRADPG